MGVSYREELKRQAKKTRPKTTLQARFARGSPEDNARLKAVKRQQSREALHYGAPKAQGRLIDA